MTNADWLISPWAAQILPAVSRERVRMAKIKETERERIQPSPGFFSRATRDKSACEKHVPPVISGESGRTSDPSACLGAGLAHTPLNDWGNLYFSANILQQTNRNLPNTVEQEKRWRVCRAGR